MSGRDVPWGWDPKSFDDSIHGLACQSHTCRNEGADSEQCAAVQELIDGRVEASLHEEAEKLRQDFEGKYRRARVIHPGLLQAADDIDPYCRIEPFDPRVDEVHPAGGLARADCKECRAGEEHWHRKADNKPII